MIRINHIFIKYSSYNTRNFKNLFIANYRRTHRGWVILNKIKNPLLSSNRSSLFGPTSLITLSRIYAVSSACIALQNKLPKKIVGQAVEKRISIYLLS